MTTRHDYCIFISVKADKTLFLAVVVFDFNCSLALLSIMIVSILGHTINGLDFERQSINQDDLFKNAETCDILV